MSPPPVHEMPTWGRPRCTRQRWLPGLKWHAHHRDRRAAQSHPAAWGGDQGYTLIEILAVVVLLGLVTSLTVSGLSRALRSDPAADALARLGDQLMWVHHQAIGRGASLTVTPDGWWSPTEGIAPLHLSRDVEVSWQDSQGTAVDQLTFDRQGRSIDLVIRIASPTGHRSLRWVGLTGGAVMDCDDSLLTHQASAASTAGSLPAAVPAVASAAATRDE